MLVGFMLMLLLLMLMLLLQGTCTALPIGMDHGAFIRFVLMSMLMLLKASWF